MSAVAVTPAPTKSIVVSCATGVPSSSIVVYLEAGVTHNRLVGCPVLTVNCCPGVPIGNLWSPVASLPKISPCVVNGLVPPCRSVSVPAESLKKRVVIPPSSFT